MKNKINEVLNLHAGKPEGVVTIGFSEFVLLRCRNCNYHFRLKDIEPELVYDDGVLMCPNCLASADKLGGCAIEVAPQKRAQQNDRR
jgi:hypothetical protein